MPSSRRAALVTRPTSAVVEERRVLLRQLVELERRAARGSRGRGSGAARSAPGPDSSPSRRRRASRRGPPRPGGSGRRSRAPSAARRLDPAQLELLRRRASARAPESSTSRAPGQSVAKPSSPPKTSTDSCSSGSISHCARRRMRVSCARTTSPSPGSVRSEEVVVAAPPDDERRDHARLRGQQQRRARLAGRERLDVVRDHPLQVVGRVRPRDAERTPALSQPRPCRLVCTRDAALPLESRGQGARRRIRPGAPAAGPVPHGEVARAPRRRRPARRPRDVAAAHLRRGRGGGHARLRAAARAAGDRGHDRHPLRHALEPLRRRLPRRPLARARGALPAAAARRTSRSRTPRPATPRTSRSPRSTRRTRSSSTRPTASR